ncbi:MAG: ComEC/Rec2 family competence protein [Bacilli bacterium]
MIYFLLLVSFLCGLWFLKLHWLIAIVFIILLLAFALYQFRKKGLFICLLFCLLGCGVSLIDKIEPLANETYQGFVTTSKENYFLFKVKGQTYYVYQKDHPYEGGDYLTILGRHNKIKMTSYESRFNFSSYLNDQGVFYEIKAQKITAHFLVPIRLKTYREKFLAKFDDNSRVLLDAFLFSTKNYDHELISLAGKLNLIYLFSLSSLYLRVLILGVEYLLHLKLSFKNTKIITFIFFLPLFIFSFIKISVRKICLLYILKYLNDYHFKKKWPYLSLLSFLAIGFLITNFHLAYQLSFLLSFGLSYLFIFLRNFFQKIHPKKRKYFYPLFLFIFLLPLHLSSSGELHIFQLFNQLFVFPFHLLYVSLGIISLYFLPLVKTLGFFSKMFLNLYTLFAKIDLKIITGSPSILFYLLFYFAYFLFVYLKEINYEKLATKVLLTLPLLIVVSSLPIHNLYEQAIYFINVGQGDAILIKNYEYHILIDTGGNLYFDMAEEVLIPFFKKKKILKLDYLITTHNDFDHNGAAPSLLENFSVKSYLTKKEDFPLEIKQLTLENLNIINYDNDNDNSLVLYFKLMKKEWLLMGDASKVVEEDILNNFPLLNCNYLKIGHHGSNTSTSENFLKSLTPQEAIISCGLNNSYNHPHPDVINLLNKYDITIRRTDLEGTICYSSLTF